MSKSKKIVISVIVVAVIIVLIPCAVYLVDMSMIYMTHIVSITSTPDSSEWILENKDYTVVPVIDDESVTFYVEDKNGKFIFDSQQSWRDWDFKYINIDENNVITVFSGDTGEYIYKLNDDGSFYLASPVY